MRSVTAGDRPAELVGLLEGGNYAAAVQRNVIARGDGEEVLFAAITLVTARDGHVAALQYFVSDQYATDALWSRKLEDV